jgi:hypothetical protein
MKYSARRRRAVIGAACLCSALTVIPAAGPALAVTYDCTICKRYCYEGQQTNGSGYTGITGNITDPSATNLDGDYNQHVALWNGITSNVKNGQQGCGPAADPFGECWVQVGMAQGDIGGQKNSTGTYEAYFENAGPSETYVIRWFAHSAVPINGNGSYTAEVYNDGVDGHLGWPQFQGYVNGYELDAGEEYFGTGEVSSTAEILTDTSNCPTLTSGSPYQNFGTDSSGNHTSADELHLSTTGFPETYSLWTGNPGPLEQTPYWYTKLDGPSAFRTNGPSGGPA